MSHIQSPDWLIRIALNKSPDEASFLRMTDLPVTSAWMSPSLVSRDRFERRLQDIRLHLRKITLSMKLSTGATRRLR